jgi:Arc/MetJ family transcription regulator
LGFCAILAPVRKTTIAIDEELAAEAGRALGTKGLTATVNQSMREVVASAARRRFVERLRSMEGMDLDKPDVMSQAWR